MDDDALIAFISLCVIENVSRYHSPLMRDSALELSVQAATGTNIPDHSSKMLLQGSAKQIEIMILILYSLFLASDVFRNICSCTV